MTIERRCFRIKQITISDQVNTAKRFTFYDFDADSGTILRRFEGFEYSSVRESIDDVAGAAGAVYVNSKFGRRRMGITGDLIGTDVFANRRVLVTALRQTGVMKLLEFTTYDDLELQCEVEVLKYDNPYTHEVHTFLIEMVAPDYRFYSQELFSFNIDKTVLQGGASIPTSMPMSLALYSSPDSDLDRILTSNGTESTEPIFTITGPGTGFTVGNTTSDKEFVLDLTLVGGDTVEVDVKNKTVIKNGVTNVYPDFSGDFWSIEPGENELRFFIESGSDADSMLNISYRDAYAGI